MADLFYEISEDFLELPNCNIYVKKIGFRRFAGKAPIVFLHDSLGCSELWRNFPQEVAAATMRPCLLYDRRGYGRSDTLRTLPGLNFIREEGEFLVNELLPHLKINEFSLLGHSVGGAMALEAAAVIQSPTLKVVTLSAQAFPEDITLNGVRAAVEIFKSDAQMKKLRNYHGPRAEWVFDAWTKTWLAKEFIEHWSLSETLPKISGPVMVIHGDRDEYGSEKHAEFLRKYLPNPRVIILKNCGHLPQKDCPEQVLQALKDFL